MTEANKKLMFDVLLHGVQIAELEAVCADEVEALAPIVDDIERQAEMRTQFQGWLQMLHHRGPRMRRIWYFGFG